MQGAVGSAHSASVERSTKDNARNEGGGGTTGAGSCGAPLEPVSETSVSLGGGGSVVSTGVSSGESTGESETGVSSVAASESVPSGVSAPGVSEAPGESTVPGPSALSAAGGMTFDGPDGEAHAHPTKATPHHGTLRRTGTTQGCCSALWLTASPLSVPWKSLVIDPKRPECG
jgi:hypothetical protein